LIASGYFKMFVTPPPRAIAMPQNTDAQIATADVLTLLLHNQHALAAAIEEIAVWVQASGSSEIHETVVGALETLDMNAAAISAGILKIREL